MRLPKLLACLHACSLLSSPLRSRLPKPLENIGLPKFSLSNSLLPQKVLGDRVTNKPTHMNKTTRYSDSILFEVKMLQMPRCRCRCRSRCPDADSDVSFCGLTLPLERERESLNDIFTLYVFIALSFHKSTPTSL